MNLTLADRTAYITFTTSNSKTKYITLYQKGTLTNVLLRSVVYIKSDSDLIVADFPKITNIGNTSQLFYYGYAPTANLDEVIESTNNAKTVPAGQYAIFECTTISQEQPTTSDFVTIKDKNDGLLAIQLSSASSSTSRFYFDYIGEDYTLSMADNSVLQKIDFHYNKAYLTASTYTYNGTSYPYITVSRILDNYTPHYKLYVTNANGEKITSITDGNLSVTNELSINVNSDGETWTATSKA